MKNDYPKVSLGELIRLERRPVKVRADEQYQEIGIYCFGRGVFHKIPRSGFEVGEKDLFLLKEGDFILQVTFAWEGAVAIISAAEDGMYGSTRFPTFRVDEKRCVPQFLLHYFKTKDGLQQLVKICPGSAGRNRVLSIKRIPEVLVPLPSVDEQRRIVARIEELSEQVKEARSLRHQAAGEVDSLVNAHLRTTCELLAQRHGTTRLEKLIADAGYGSSQKCSPERAEGAVPVLRIPNVASERIDLDNLKFTRLSPRDQERLLLTSGDILVVRTNGSLELVGRCAVVDDLPEPMAFASYMIRLRFDTAAIFPAYAQQMLRHLRVSGQLIDFARTTAGQYNVSLGRLRSVEIPVPPLSEQRQIVSYLNDLQKQTDALKALQAETSAALDALMPSTLDKAFSGEP
jgi:type I restriction enzyme S subunit